MMDSTDELPLRPIGFRPEEISGLHNRRVIEEHASAAAFLWLQRERAVDAPHYRLKHLAMLDERTRAHLQGIRVAGHVGWDVAVAALEQGDAGSVFVVSYLAFSSGDAAKMRHALQLGLSQAQLERALEAALIWLELPEVSSPIGALQRSAAADHQRVALGALAGHGVDPGETLQRALENDDVRLRAEALRIVGQFKRRDLSPAVKSCVRDPDPTCQFWAGWTLALLGYPEGPIAAFDEGLCRPEQQSRALEIAMRFGESDWARQTVRTLASRPEMLRLAIQASAAFGDPAVVPWLLRQASQPRYARVAGEAIATITGADLDYLGLKQDAPEGESEDAAVEDKNLPWPDLQRLTEWWSAQSGRYGSGQRYLAGQPISVASSLGVLREGYQRQRRAAALELARLTETAPLWSISARADRQQRGFPR